MKGRIESAIMKSDGLFRLRPAWVARTFLPPGKRYNLKEEDYDVGERGWITERWLGSVTDADNAIKVENEGLSFLELDAENRGDCVLLRDAVAASPGLIMGEEYASKHAGLGRLPKIFDNADRLPFHLHQRQKDVEALGRCSKDEAYYFPAGIPLGAHPETFFGLHPSIVEENRKDAIAKLLEAWDSDEILNLSRAFRNVPDEGYLLPSGFLHAPGTALTIELQEASDVFAMLQAHVAGKIISKENLYHDVTKENREKKGVWAVIDQIDWEANGDPYFWENHRTYAKPVEGSKQDGGEEFWVFYGTPKFSGKKLVIAPGEKYLSKDKGVYNALVWAGEGQFGSLAVKGQCHTLNDAMDEVFVTAPRAAKGVEIKNTGNEPLVIIKFFGPDVNPEAAGLLTPYKGKLSR